MGAPLDWIEAHADYPHKDWCLLWPFFRDKNGRGVVSLDGKRHYAHRVMCRRVHGEGMTPEEYIYGKPVTNGDRS